MSFEKNMYSWFNRAESLLRKRSPKQKMMLNLSHVALRHTYWMCVRKTWHAVTDNCLAHINLDHKPREETQLGKATCGENGTNSQGRATLDQSIPLPVWRKRAARKVVSKR